MRYTLFVLVCVVAIAIAGCQSGRVGEAKFSADGRVVAFRDWRYQTVYLADESGVRPCGAGDFLLSPDGRLLLILEPRSRLESRAAYVGGQRATIYDRSDHSLRSTKLPCDMPGYVLDVSDASGPEVRQTTSPIEAPRPPLFARVFFGSDARITIGPIGATYWSWSPDQDWRRTDQAPPTPQALSRPIIFWFEPVECSLVELPPDGWNPTRTVWVRLDGSTLEVLRRNDLPLRIFGNCLYTPIVVHPWGLQRWLDEWGDAVRELIGDARACAESLLYLQHAIDQRRTARAQNHGD